MSPDGFAGDKNASISNGDLSVELKIFKYDEWSTRAADLIQQAIDKDLRDKGICSVMLTGGRSAERLYATWAALPAFQSARGVCFYFGDERCVSPSHPDSNYGMARRTLFARGLPDGCFLARLEADDPNREAASLRYDGVMPDEIDVLLLGVGEDGHIASLFPGSSVMSENVRRVMPVFAQKPPHERLTITSLVVTSAKVIFVLAPGKAKAQIVARALSDPENVMDLPARLALRATWLLDEYH